MQFDIMKFICTCIQDCVTFTRNYFFFLADERKISLKPLEVLLLFFNHTVNLNEKIKIILSLLSSFLVADCNWFTIE